MNPEKINNLKAHFPFEEVDARIQVTSGDKKTGMAIFYVDSRAIQNRLDDVIGAFNWSNSFSSWQGNAQICGISIYDEARKEWLTKYDGAENTDIESTKGGLSGAFKRAAVQWGIGRYLYQIPGVWVEIEQRGKSSIIKDSQLSKLRNAYDTAIKNIFGAEVLKQKSETNAGSSSGPQQSSGNHENQRPPAPPMLQNTGSNQSQSAPQTSGNGYGNEQESQTDSPPANIFKVKSMKSSGESSQLLELCDGNGVITSAYIRSSEQGIAVGTHLNNVKIEEKNNSFGKYNLIASYEIAA